MMNRHKAIPVHELVNIYKRNKLTYGCRTVMPANGRKPPLVAGIQNPLHGFRIPAKRNPE